MAEDDLDLVADAGISAVALVVPPVGLLGVVLRRLDTSRRRRQQELIDRLGERLDEVKDHLDTDYVKSEDFDALVEEVIEKGQQRKELDKREYYAILLSNAATARPDSDDLERMIDTLGRVRASHLWLLVALLREYSWTDEASVFGSSFEQEFKKAVPDVVLDRVKLDWRDLQAAGLLAGYPTGIMTGHGARTFRAYVTDLGKRFHQFVMLPYSDVHPPS